MNTNMLAISNMFSGTIVAGPALAKTTAVKKRNQISHPTVDNVPISNDSGPTTVDNIIVKHLKRLNTGARKEFSHTFREEITTEVPQKAKQSRNIHNQKRLANADRHPSVIQPLLAQWSLKIEHGPKGIAKKVEHKAGLERAQLVGHLKPDKSPLPAGDTAKADDTKPVPFINQKQIGSQAALNQIKKAPLVTDTLADKGEKANRVQIPEVRLLHTIGPDNERNGKGLTLIPLIRADHRITTADGKLEDLSVSNTFSSQKSPSLVGEGLKPQVLFKAEGEINNVIQKPAITGKPGVPVVPKKSLSNLNISPVQDKPSGLQFQAVRINAEKSTLIAVNTVTNKTAAGQPIRIKTQQFSGPPAQDVTNLDPNVPGNQAYQHLHQAQVQLSAGPNKGRDGSASGKNNANSGFEQILFGNNATGYIEEQTSILPEAVKTDNMPIENLPNGVSASITEQILESIQSSSSQQSGTQQITIRLNPPELGKVFIKFEEQENQLTGLVEVSKAQTKYEVEQALPEIIQNLADCGIQIKRLEVMLTNQNGQQSYGDESLQDGSFQHHHDLLEWDNPDNHSTLDTNETGIFGNSGSYQDGLEAQMQITANSINILI